MKITVTKEHIENGEAKDCGRCPIALALIDAGFKDFVVDVGQVCIGTAVHELPTIANNFILRFDKGDKVTPISFELGAVPA